MARSTARSGNELVSLVDDLTAASGHEARTPLRAELATFDPVDVAALLDHEDCFTRWELVNVLGESADPDVADRVVAFALAEDEVHARWRSFWAVSRFDRTQTTPPLRAALAEHDHGQRPSARPWRAALMLSMLLGRPGSVGAEREYAAEPSLRDLVVDVLLDGLRLGDDWMQWEALSALKATGGRQTAECIAAFTRPDHAQPLRQEAVLALGAIGGDVACRALRVALRDPSREVRWRASSALAMAAGRRAAPSLRAALRRESDPDVRRQLDTDLHAVVDTT